MLQPRYYMPSFYGTASSSECCLGQLGQNEFFQQEGWGSRMALTASPFDPPTSVGRPVASSNWADHRGPLVAHRVVSLHRTSSTAVGGKADMSQTWLDRRD